jgi:hypothetical protein
MDVPTRANPVLTKRLDATASLRTKTPTCQRLSILPGVDSTRYPRPFHIERNHSVATNKNKHDGHREGAVKERSQFTTPSGHPAKRDTTTGQIMNVKSDKQPFKGVRREK